MRRQRPRQMPIPFERDIPVVLPAAIAEDLVKALADLLLASAGEAKRRPPELTLFSSVSVSVSVSKAAAGASSWSGFQELLGKLVTLTFASWNQIHGWLRHLEGLRGAA